MTIPANSVEPSMQELMAKERLVGEIAVRPVLEEGEVAPPDEKRPEPGSPVTFDEELTTQKLTPVEVQTPPPPARHTCGGDDHLRRLPAATAPAAAAPLATTTPAATTPAPATTPAAPTITTPPPAATTAAPAQTAPAAAQPPATPPAATAPAAAPTLPPPPPSWPRRPNR